MRQDSYLHGPAHMMRVFILQELICDQLERQAITVDREATRWATSVHDIGRVDDGLDLEHGRRSAEWMNANIPSGLSPETIDIATYIVHWHVPSDDRRLDLLRDHADPQTRMGAVLPGEVPAGTVGLLAEGPAGG